MRQLFLLLSVLTGAFSSIAQPDFSSNAKSTAGGTRWYNHGALIDSMTQGNSSYSFVPIWYDSAVQEPSFPGIETIRYISAAQALDPIYFMAWNDSDYFDTSNIAITPTQDYDIDSITFSGAYVKNINRSPGIVDTLILSVSPVGAGLATNPSYVTHFNLENWTVDYVCHNCVDSFLYGFTIDSNDVDIVNKASNVPGGTTWKVLLVDSMRLPNITDVADAMTFTFPVMVSGAPGAVTIPAGYGTAITITFKSGDVVIPGDTFFEYHHFMLVGHEAEGLGATMPFANLHYGLDDRNMSNLMKYDNPSVYWPTIFLEGRSTADFKPEYLSIGMNAVCSNCPTIGNVLSVSKLNTPITINMEAYPNPAIEEVSIMFAINQNTNATVSITNAMAQVVASQNVNAVSGQQNRVTFATDNLASGVYFYTVEAKGQRTTNRFLVAH